ncbi:MAG: glutamyl-tRNA(Gln) amidotransferase, subunit [Candidatus Doudnabacteria bacterium]|nr:glutamyl-tRNA(Gln) amidotransferase, subunit [Candidatus Doudnabacteria bacterium]
MLANLELSELQDKLRKKEISSVELTKYFLERIKKHNESLNAFLTVTEDLALAQAVEADKILANEPNPGPLTGIPFAAKDLFSTKGVRTTASSKILDQFIPVYDATTIKKMYAEKTVMLGKTNLDEFAHGSSTETSAYGPSKNPWDLSRIPGGSSGGSAAAVAAGLAPFALATETGGSIRQPASLTGISGWKPTYGRVSRYGVIAMTSSNDSPGTMARSVKDLALTAEFMSGYDPSDGTTANKPVPNYADNLKSDLTGMRIGIPKEYFVEGMEPDVQARVMEAIEQLKKLGAEIIDVSLPLTRYGSLVYAIVTPSEISSNLAKFDGIRFGHQSKEAKTLNEIYTQSREQGFGDEAKRRIMTGTYALSAGYKDAYYLKAQKVRRLLVNEFDQVFQRVDALVCASVPNVATKIGFAKDNPLHGYIADQLNIPASMAGLPALSVPAGFGAAPDGPAGSQLPVGLQIIGPQWGEQTIFNIGHAFQQVTEWHKKFPEEFAD